MVALVKVSAVLGAVAVSAVFAVVETLPQPTEIWPTSVSGWVSLFLGFTSIIGVLYALHRAAQKPLEKQVTESRAAAERDMNAFREAVSAQMNGFGRRVDSIEAHNREIDGTVNGVLQALVESRQDRKYMGDSLNRIETGMETIRKEHTNALSRILEILAENHRERAR